MRDAEFRKARKTLGLTQTQMGALLGISKRQVINLEMGRSPIRKPYADLIGHALRDRAPGASPVQNGETK
jgi:DNA-binding XRE family transcriptional regulator